MASRIAKGELDAETVYALLLVLQAIVGAHAVTVVHPESNSPCKEDPASPTIVLPIVFGSYLCIAVIGRPRELVTLYYAGAAQSIRPEPKQKVQTFLSEIKCGEVQVRPSAPMIPPNAHDDNLAILMDAWSHIADHPVPPDAHATLCRQFLVNVIHPDASVETITSPAMPATAIGSLSPDGSLSRKLSDHYTAMCQLVWDANCQISDQISRSHTARWLAEVVQKLQDMVLVVGHSEAKQPLDRAKAFLEREMSLCETAERHRADLKPWSEWLERAGPVDMDIASGDDGE
jgi:hypothetical protein